MTHNHTVDQDATRQAVHELRISPGAASKNSRVRQSCSARTLAFRRTAVPGEEAMSVYMFSQTLLIYSLGKRGLVGKRATGFPAPVATVRWQPGQQEVGWCIFSLSHLWPSELCWTLSTEPERRTAVFSEPFPNAFLWPVSSQSAYSRVRGGWQFKLC